MKVKGWKGVTFQFLCVWENKSQDYSSNSIIKTMLNNNFRKKQKDRKGLDFFV